MIETLRTPACSPRPAPPLGVAPWDRKRRWFRWYVVHSVLMVIYKVRCWRWKKRTGNRQEIL